MSDTEAIQLDTYLDRLLAGPEAGPAAVDALPAVDPGLVDTAARLRIELVRFHPSFRFEERLARRLLEVAEAQLRGVIVGHEPVARPVTLAATAGVAGVGATRTPVQSIDSRAAADERHRGLLVGGAIASGVIASGVSLAGAGLVAWRRARALHRWERLI